MKTYYIRFNSDINITHVYLIKQFDDLYNTEVEFDLLNDYSLYELDSLDVKNKTCTLKKKE